jgi:TonB family protein
MRSFAGLPVIVFALLVWFPALGAGQEPPTQPQMQSRQAKEVTGTIASVDETCSSFVLSQEVDGKKTEITFLPWMPRVPWDLDPNGCAIVSPNGNKFALKPGIRATVEYFTVNDKNVVRRVLVEGHWSSPFRLKLDEPIQVGNNAVDIPVCIYCPSPPYTVEARSAGIEGSVLLEIVVLPDGTTSDVRVVRGLNKGLDASAVETVRQWSFRPVLGPDNRPLSKKIPVEVNFRLAK